MPILKLERTGPIWGLAGFILGAVLSGSAVGALGLSTSLSPPSDKPQGSPSEMDELKQQLGEMQKKLDKIGGKE